MGFHLSPETISMERHGSAARGKSHIATDSLQLADLTSLSPPKEETAPGELERN